MPRTAEPIEYPTRYNGIYLQSEVIDGERHWWIATDDGAVEEYHGTVRPSDAAVEAVRAAYL